MEGIVDDVVHIFFLADNSVQQHILMGGIIGISIYPVDHGPASGKERVEVDIKHVPVLLSLLRFRDHFEQ